jgi:biotin carboxyl carrier protein
MSIRATLLGAHAGLVEPLVVDPDGLPGGDDRAGQERHQVLILELARAHSAAARRLEVVVDGWRFELEVEPEARAALRDKARRDRGAAGHSGPAEVRAIIPGVIVSVAVTPGETVGAGQQLLVVEAMKMQNELRAPRAGTIGRVAVGTGSTIEVGDLLVVVE